MDVSLKVINKLLDVIYTEFDRPDITKQNLGKLLEHLETHCLICGSEYSKEYLDRYGMCMGCYGFMVGADNCPIQIPDKLYVIKGLSECLSKLEQE